MPKTRERPRGARIVLAASSAILAIMSIFTFLGEPSREQSWPLIITAISSVWLIAFLACTYRQFGTVYLFSNAYVIVLFVFHFSYAYIYSLSGLEVPFLFDDESGQWYRLASWAVLIALAFFGIGVAAASPRRADSSTSSTSSGLPRNTQVLGFWLGLGLLAASFFALLMLGFSVGNILSYSRTEIFAGVGDTRGLGFGLMILPSAIILLVCTASTAREKVLAYSAGAVAFLAIMFLGERSAACSLH